MLLLTTAGLALHRSSRGTESPPDRPVGIAVVEQRPDRTEYVTPPEPTDVQTESTEQTEAAAASAAAPPAGLDAELDLEGVLADLTATPLPAGNGTAGDAMEAVESPGKGDDALGDGGSQRTTAKLFGVSGSGSRFVFVVDRSDSMNGYGGRPLEAAKRELTQSIHSLSEQQQFQIIFYNNRPTPFTAPGQRPGLLTGDEPMRYRAEQYIRNVSAFGGTEHMDALRLALQMDPDVLFFLTDARVPRLTRRQLDEIRARAASAGTTIHAIEFGSEPEAPSDSFLRTLASDNEGQYRYLDVRKFTEGGNWKDGVEP